MYPLRPFFGSSGAIVGLRVLHCWSFLWGTRTCHVLVNLLSTWLGIGGCCSDVESRWFRWVRICLLLLTNSAEKLLGSEMGTDCPGKVRGGRCGIRRLWPLRVVRPAYMHLSQFLPRFWMVQFSCSPVFLMVLWSWFCVATTTPYLLIVGSDGVFGVNCSILFVVIGLQSSPVLMTHVSESFLLLWFASLESNNLSSRIREWRSSLQRRVFSWWFPDIPCCI